MNKTRPHPTIGLLIDNVTGRGEYQAIVWTGVADAARALGANLICFAGGSLGFSPSNEFEPQRNVVYELVTPDNADGLILISSTLYNFASPEQAESFNRRYRSLPRVSIGATTEEIPCVLVDSRRGLHDAIMHLIEQHGRQRIAFVRGPAVNKEAEERYAIYMETLREHGLPVDPRLVAQGDFLPQSGRAAMHHLLDEEQATFDAVIAANDLMALGALQALQERGKHVPYDVAIVGFDNLEEGRVITPPLTTVRQPMYDLGREAVGLLLRLLAGEEVPQQITLSTDVVVRQSCGCFYQTVLQTKAIPEMEGPADQPFEAFLAGAREQIISEMSRAVGSSSAGQQAVASWSAQLLDSFSVDLGTVTLPGAFLPALDSILREVFSRGDDVTAWHGAISALRHLTLSHLSEPETLSRAVELWHQAWMLIGETGNRAQTKRRLQAGERAETLRDISQALITTFDVPALGDVIARQLPRLGIARCHISLYEPGSEPDALAERSRLILAYDENGRAEAQEGTRFLTRQLAPQELLPARYHLLVDSLYFRNEKFGLILFEVGPLDGIIYTTLRAQISSALKGAMLFQERRRAEEELARSNRELEQFAYVASHDLQEPLRMIRSYLQLLERRYKGKIDTDADEFISYAIDGATRMQRMILDLLQYSRVETQGRPLYVTDCNEMLERALNNLEVAIRESQARIAHDELPTLLADGIQLMQLFQNLISNAIKFRGEKTPEIHVGAEQVDGGWLFSVRDNGVGIEPEYYERIFLLFERLHNQDEIEGAGIGLATCKKIVERHDGRIWVESEPGQGSTFYFTLPHRVEKAQELSPRAGETDPVPGGQA